MEVIRSGGCAEGFRMKGTDVDQMYVDKLTKIVAETPKNLCTSLAVVKLMQLSKVPPGCLARNNKVGVMGKEEAEEYEKVIRTMVTEEVTEKKGGVAFGLSFISEEGTPKPVPSRLMCGDKEEDFEKWRENQEKVQSEKQDRAQQRREEALVQKKIENAHKETERLEKYVNAADG
uniref:Uncharacterized protein n=1 Tax=Magallana gigas TaxID=29159 RepID=K1S062_MAGGI